MTARAADVIAPGNTADGTLFFSSFAGGASSAPRPAPRSSLCALIMA